MMRSSRSMKRATSCRRTPSWFAAKRSAFWSVASPAQRSVLPCNCSAPWKVKGLAFSGAKGSATSATSATTAGNITGIAAITNGGTGSSTAAAALVALGQQTGATGAALTPSGTTAQRPTPATGHFRFNTTLGKFEGYTGAAWGAVGGGATGGGADEVFVENGQTVTTNYTLSTNKNASSVGPITINAGITVTVPSGSTWAIL